MSRFLWFTAYIDLQCSSVNSRSVRIHAGRTAAVAGFSRYQRVCRTTWSTACPLCSWLWTHTHTQNCSLTDHSV